MGVSYPICVNLTNKKCIIVGGGRSARRKLEGLLSTGADIVVIAPQLHPRMKALVEEYEVHWEARQLEQDDLSGSELVFVATDDDQQNRQAYEMAHSAGIWVNVNGEAESGDFAVPAAVHRGSMTLSVSAPGASHVLTKKLRLQLEQAFGPEYESFLEFFSQCDQELKSKVDSNEKRKEVLKSIIESDCLDLLRRNQTQMAQKRVEQIKREFLR